MLTLCLSPLTGRGGSVWSYHSVTEPCSPCPASRCRSTRTASDWCRLSLCRFVFSITVACIHRQIPPPPPHTHTLAGIEIERLLLWVKKAREYVVGTDFSSRLAVRFATISRQIFTFPQGGSKWYKYVNSCNQACNGFVNTGRVGGNRASNSSRLSQLPTSTHAALIVNTGSVICQCFISILAGTGLGWQMGGRVRLLEVKTGRRWI